MATTIRRPTREARHEALGPPLLYRVEDAAELLDLSRTKVYELCASGQLTSVKIGKSRRIPAQALEAFIADLTEPG
jgi:excisionase family DNA binding protein